MPTPFSDHFFVNLFKNKLKDSISTLAAPGEKDQLAACGQAVSRES